MNCSLDTFMVKVCLHMMKTYRFQGEQTDVSTKFYSLPCGCVGCPPGTAPAYDARRCGILGTFLSSFMPLNVDIRVTVLSVDINVVTGVLQL